VPRPPKLTNPKIVPIIFEYDQFLLLKQISQAKGISISEIIRDLVNEYLAKHGLIEAKAIARDSGVSVLKNLDYTVTIMEIRELNQALKRCINMLESNIPGNERWLNAKHRGMQIVKKLNALIQKAGVVDNKHVKEAVKLIHEFKKHIETE